MGTAPLPGLNERYRILLAVAIAQLSERKLNNHVTFPVTQNCFAPQALLRNDRTLSSQVGEIRRFRLLVLSPGKLVISPSRKLLVSSSHRQLISFRPGLARLVVRLSACVHVFTCSVQHSNSGNSNNNALARRASR